MHVSVEPLILELAQPFRIAHGTSTSRENALVRIGDFVGEAALPPYYEYRVDDIKNYIAKVDFSPLEGAGGLAIDKILQSLPPGPLPAIAAVDMALYDMWGKTLGHPLSHLFGVQSDRPIVTSYALSIPSDLDSYREIIDRVNHYPALKLKLGSGDLQFDEEIVRVARSAFNGILSVDANAAWTVSDAVNIIPRLTEYDLAYVEQPIGFNDSEDWHLLRRLLRRPGVPLIADESVRSTEDVIVLAGAADGVNVKIAKCGGIRNVRRIITVARALDLQVMIGCMIESSLALTAAAHLAAFADHVDIDGMLYLKNDPYRGVEFADGYLKLPIEPGLGIVERG